MDKFDTEVYRQSLIQLSNMKYDVLMDSMKTLKHDLGERKIPLVKSEYLLGANDALQYVIDKIDRIIDLYENN